MRINVSYAQMRIGRTLAAASRHHRIADKQAADAKMIDAAKMAGDHRDDDDDDYADCHVDP